MEELGGGKTIQPVFITLDPERDTSENLESFSQNFHKDLIYLTGSPDQIDQAKKVYRVYAAHASEDKDAEIDHSSLIYLMDKDGHYRAHFDHETPSEDIVKRVKAKGLKIYGVTILARHNSLPGAGPLGPWNSSKTDIKNTVNDWIRTKAPFDRVLDFDKVVRDPANTNMMIAPYNCDGTHPTTLGYYDIGRSIPLDVFKKK